MNVELLSLSIISLVFTTLLLGFVLGVVIISYRRILDNIHTLRQKELEMKERSNNQADQIIEQARAKAMEIVTGANNFASQQQKDINAQLAKFAATQQEHYEQALTAIKSHTLDAVEKIAMDIKANTLSDFKQLLANLEQQIESSKTDFRTNLSNLYQKDYEEAKKQLEDYKKQSMEKIDANSKEIIKDYSIKVFGRMLSYEEHEDLIMESLEEAKKAHVL